jgi:hypothetical protein
MEATFNEFPFVETLPKREKSKLRKLWDELEDLRRVSAERGNLLPPAFVAELAGVSRQRIHELMGKGILERVEVNGRPFVTEGSLREWMSEERRVGRPPNVATTTGEQVRRSARYAAGVIRGGG